MATKISDITTHATTPLNGDERMEMAQDGSTVYVTPQDIADLAGENLFLSYVPTSTRKIISDQSDNFAATGYSGTMYTNFNAMSNFFATLGNAEVGVFYEFAATSSDYSLAIRPDTDSVIVFWDVVDGSRAVAQPDPLSYLQLLPGQSATLTCVETGIWFATVNNGGTYVLD